MPYQQEAVEYYVKKKMEMFVHVCGPSFASVVSIKSWVKFALNSSKTGYRLEKLHIKFYFESVDFWYVSPQQVTLYSLPQGSMFSSLLAFHYTMTSVIYFHIMGNVIKFSHICLLLYCR